MEKSGEILIYQTENGETSVDVRLENETIWLTQAQIVQLFDKSKATISEHTRNIFNEGELERSSVVRKFRTTARDGKSYETEYYNLDVIISIGYRVKSKRGTQFRIWASQVLKQYLVQGYALHEKRLQTQAQQLAELAQTVHLFEQSLQNDQLQLTEAKGLLSLITDYTRSFVLLNQFDSNRLETDYLQTEITYEIHYAEARAAIDQLRQQLMTRREATPLFGNEKDDSFQGVLGSVVQTFGGHYLYASIEEQAAHLLYFTIKNHPFTDGNKRIGAFLFIWFLEKNQHRFTQKGQLKINENALVALALLVAQSDPSQKELMIKLVVNLINQNQ